MAATAIIDPATTRVVDVSITNQGNWTAEPDTSLSLLVGGLNFSETLIEALVTDDDNNASICSYFLCKWHANRKLRRIMKTLTEFRHTEYCGLQMGQGFMNYMR